MDMPVLIDPTTDLNAPAKSSHMWYQPPFHAMHTTAPMPDPVLPCYSATGEIDEILTQRMGQNLKLFWHQQMNEMKNFTGFKGPNPLPLARVKKIMKSDPDVKMISADTAPLFAKACEIFILEMTLRAWIHTESCNRRTIQRADIAEAVRDSEIYDFLIDFFPFRPHCIHHTGMHPNGVEVGPMAAHQPVIALPGMNVSADLNQTEQNLEVPPEVMADSFVAHEPLDLNFAHP